MTDIQIAKNGLDGHTICLCRDGNCIFSEKKGIAPVMDLIAEGIDLTGYSAADRVVGKAAAMLFVKCGIVCVFAKTLSSHAKKVFESRGIEYSFETLAENIINRAGTDICPMEKTVLNTDNVEEAYTLLKNKLQNM